MTTPSNPAEPERTPDATDPWTAAPIDAEHADTRVLRTDADHTDTEVLGTDADHPTKVLPEASARSTLQPPKPKTSDPRASGTIPLTPPDPADLRMPAPEPTTRPATASAAPAAPAAAVARPRVRWAGILWGLVFAVTGSLLLWVLVDPARRAAVDDWWGSLTPSGFALTALLVAGGLLLIGGLSGLARRLSHRPA